MELLDIGYQQDQTIKMVKDSASILQSLVEAASAPTVQQELPDIVIPDTVTISNLPEIQKVEVINEKTLELDKVESLLLQLLKAVPTIKDERPTPTEDVRKLLILLSQDKSKEKVLELLTQILHKEYPMYQLPENIISKDGRIKVEVDRAGGGGGSSIDISDKLIILTSYALAGQDISSDPMYFAGLKTDGSWYIKRMYLSGDYTTKYANGTSGFDWSTRAGLTYSDFNTLTW